MLGSTKQSGQPELFLLLDFLLVNSLWVYSWLVYSSFPRVFAFSTLFVYSLLLLWLRFGLRGCVAVSFPKLSQDYCLWYISRVSKLCSLGFRWFQRDRRPNSSVVTRLEALTLLSFPCTCKYIPMRNCVKCVSHNTIHIIFEFCKLSNKQISKYFLFQLDSASGPIWYPQGADFKTLLTNISEGCFTERAQEDFISVNKFRSLWTVG